VARSGEQPLISVFTPAHEIGSEIDTAYRSLLRQSYSEWEWVVVDDSEAPGTAEHLASLVDRNPPGRIRVFPRSTSGSSGASKAAAAYACRGEFLVELDHDDELLPEALEVIAATFVAHPDVDFVYSDWLDWEDRPSGGGPAFYPPGWAFGLGVYASEIVDGRRVSVALAPPLTWQTVRHVVAAPNHVRAWRTESYRRIGGHDARLEVGDDYELIVRTFLNGITARIPRPLYVQHHDPAGRNASRLRNAEIHRRVEEASHRYEQAIDQRCLALGVTPSPPWPLTSWEPIPSANVVIDVIAEAAADRGRPLVSVVIPTYDRPQLLARAIESVLTQSYENLEVLVAGDNCPSIDQVIASIDDRRVRHLNLATHHDDLGASPRNCALKVMARGTLVAYLDDDNRWRGDHLESLVETLLRDSRLAFAFASLNMAEETIICRRPRHLQIDTNALLHRRFLLERFGYWRGPTETAWAQAHDWELVSRWEHEPWAASLKPTVFYTLEQSSRGQQLLAAVRAVADQERNAAMHAPL
jgi:glycosyltransferase involved in cell wall biosynthesis